jgi:hypothetical protein
MGTQWWQQRTVRSASGSLDPSALASSALWIGAGRQLAASRGVANAESGPHGAGGREREGASGRVKATGLQSWSCWGPGPGVVGRRPKKEEREKERGELM